MNEHVVDLLALYALGGLEADELKTVADHLAVCAACRAEADRQEALVAVLAASAPARTPDPRLRAATLARAGITSTAVPAARPRPARPAPSAERQPLRLSWPRWLTAGLAVLMVAVLGWNVFLTNQVVTLQHRVQYNQNALALIAGSDTAHVPLVGQGAFAAADGNAYIDQKTMDIVLVVQKLQPLPPDQTYQAWVISSQGPVSAGTFQVSENGWGMAWLDVPYVQGGAIGVSLEPKAGSPKPTHVVLLTAQ